MTAARHCALIVLGLALAVATARTSGGLLSLVSAYGACLAVVFGVGGLIDELRRETT